jgi:hypothetical protein
MTPTENRPERKAPEVLKVTPAGDEHQVVTLKSSTKAYRKEPCPGCPWRKDNTGEFPAEAFRVSANTAYDMSTHRFSCHESGAEKPATCAGFLLRGADHNMGVRLAYMRGDLVDDFSDGGHELFDSYRDMAVANGVDPEDPILKPCR